MSILIILMALVCFNPRARMGRDTCRLIVRNIGNVSIHAPAWGATQLSFLLLFDHLCFNPRARMGRDQMIHYEWSYVISSFNPRARMGRDTEQCSLARANLAVSIHAPAWGATFIHPLLSM